ncbi:MAG: tetratricopeptide repeat protein [Gaiellaceae bacterium]
MRSGLAITVWWTLMIGIALALWPLAPVPRAAFAFGGTLAAFAVWSFASLAWSSDRELTLDSFNRATLYLGVFVVVVAASRRGLVGRYLDALTLAAIAIAVVALGSRFFPPLFPDRGLGLSLPGSRTRLSFPLGYWNGLGASIALGLPLTLRAAVVWRRPLTRGVATAAIPVGAVAMYLSSSRGAMAAAVLGALVVLAVSGERWSVLAIIGGGGFASAIAVWFVASQRQLVSGPLQSGRADEQGHLAALVVLVVVAGTIAVVALLVDRISWSPPSWVGRSLALAFVAAVLVAVAFSHPGQRFDAFKAAPAANAIGNHLASVNGSGRWQFWTAAVDQWRAHPFGGGGAGTYGQWWLAHASVPYLVRNAHSLFLETLGELGVVGLLLLVATFVIGLGVAVKRATTLREPQQRAAVAALLGVVVAWLVSASLDWVWQIPAVTVVVFVAFGLLTGPATATPLGDVRRGTVRGARSFGLGVAAFIAGWLVLACTAVPWFAAMKISESQREARQGNGAAAAAAAIAAKGIEPWASTPYLQLALVSEQAGDTAAARAWIGNAIDRSDNSWQLWLVAARLDTKAGFESRARRELARAVALNPRSPLFAGLNP